MLLLRGTTFLLLSQLEGSEGLGFCDTWWSQSWARPRKFVLVTRHGEGRCLVARSLWSLHGIVKLSAIAVAGGHLFRKAYAFGKDRRL